jgi:hypothetical protein
MHAMPGPNQITPTQLMRQIGTPDAPDILDVRLPEDLAADPRLIPGSRHIAHDPFDHAWAPTDRRVVVSCQRGKKLSEGVASSHRGDACTFDAMLDDFGLHTDALDRLALVVRAADTDRHDLSPPAAGLLAISVGLSRQFRDDLHQLDAGMAVYDALYRWARDGHDEGHDWPAGRMP